MKNQTKQHSSDTHQPTIGRSGGGDQPRPSSLNRRSFLSRAGAATAVVAAATVGLPSPLLSQNTDDPPEVSDNISGSSRRVRSFRIRAEAAIAEYKVHPPPQINNGDETRYPDFIGNYSQGLPHNSIGEVDRHAYQALLTAVNSGDPADFAKIPLGGTLKLADPQGGLAFDLEGTDCGQLGIPPAPRLASVERADEMVENYWMALARDVPLSQYGKEPITEGAIADLNKLSHLKGPKVGGRVTAKTLFRGSTPWDLIGPYISQLFVMPLNLGALSVAQKYNTYAANTDYLTDFASWLAVQNGTAVPPPPVVGTTYIKNGRDLGAWARVDFTFQAYLFAAQWILGLVPVPLNPGNPYLTITNQTGVQTFGAQHIVDLFGEVANRALKASWHQKWFVHRALRPMAYGGLVHNKLTGVADYPINKEVLNSAAVQEVFKNNGTYLLPTAYPEGGPLIPAYSGGHSAVAGACATALKAFFNENFVIPDPMVATDDGQSLVPYTGSDAGKITLGGELNKVASNVAQGRNIASLHWRSDALEGLLLGEKVAISVLRDQRHTYNEPFHGFTFTKFDGKTITV
jgi:hypothetical protein